MDYKNGKCNIPFFYYEETQKQISKTGGREWKSKEEIEKEHAKYNTKGKANVIGWISEDLARKIVGVSHFFICCNAGIYACLYITRWIHNNIRNIIK